MALGDRGSKASSKKLSQAQARPRPAGRVSSRKARARRRAGGARGPVWRWSRRVSGGGEGLGVKMSLEVKWVWRGWDLLLGSIAAFYVFTVPYTKVEESFNVQVSHFDQELRIYVKIGAFEALGRWRLIEMVIAVVSKIWDIGGCIC
ncbi:hypothetical protein Syun_018607 [Stephania yunnanensis]|uniref:Uncharacterized protein n=1 Tax=Stephania yunnanensis TaxID=152371 RepID=A0AAP0ITP1_9MAGN